MSAERKRASKPPCDSRARHSSGVRAKAEITPDDLDLTDEQRERIDRLFADLWTMSLYDLLGTAPTADTKAIERAFDERVSELDPDRFDRKRIGDYKRKLRAIIVRMSDARDILCSRQRRAEYDAANRARRLRSVEEMLAEAEAEMSGETDRAAREDVSGDR
jgi:hypothetical protein